MRIFFMYLPLPTNDSATRNKCKTAGKWDYICIVQYADFCIRVLKKLVFPVWFTGHFSIEWSWNKTGNTLNQKTCYSWYKLLGTGSTHFLRDYRLSREHLLPEGWHLREAKLSDHSPDCLRLDSAVTRIKIYSLESAIGFHNNYLLDNYLSSR